MSCAKKLSPKIEGVSRAMSAGGKAAKQLIAQLCAPCAHGKGDPTDIAKRMVDNAVICDVICCCKPTPNMQVCVDQTFSAVDEKMGYKSRYKSEISYNMRKTPPVPLMHRVNGRDTTQPTEHWQSRAWQIKGYVPGKGHIRRPDIVIVEDPAKPPYQSNIERVVEVKFGGDVEGIGQYSAYSKIAGSRAKLKVMHDSECDCSDRKRRPMPVPVSVPQKQEETSIWNGDAAQVAGVLVGVAATIALAAFPLDGPAGEMAAGAFTAARVSTLARRWGSVFGASQAIGAR